jgi:hypothetical protein
VVAPEAGSVGLGGHRAAGSGVRHFNFTSVSDAICSAGSSVADERRDRPFVPVTALRQAPYH